MMIQLLLPVTLKPNPFATASSPFQRRQQFIKLVRDRLHLRLRGRIAHRLFHFNTDFPVVNPHVLANGRQKVENPRLLLVGKSIFPEGNFPFPGLLTRY